MITDSLINSKICNELTTKINQLIYEYQVKYNLSISYYLNSRVSYEDSSYHVKLPDKLYYKNSFKNIFCSTAQHELTLRKIIIEYIKIYSYENYKCVLASVKDDELIFQLVENALPFIQYNFIKVYSKLRKMLRRIKPKYNLQCYADDVCFNSMRFILHWGGQIAFSITISNYEMQVECIESGTHKKTESMLIHYPIPHYHCHDEIIDFFIKFIKYYFEELEKKAFYIF